MTTSDRATPDQTAAGEAFMRLLAARDFRDITLSDIAVEAGLPLAALHAACDGKLDIIAGISHRVDAAVLGGLRETTSESARDRLFDLLMQRFDAQKAIRPGLAGLRRSALRDPALALALFGIANRAMRWMLEAADLAAGGVRRAIKVEGLTWIYLRAFRVFLDDESSDLARTMAALDAGLRRGEGAMQQVDKVAEFFSSLGARRKPASAPPAAEAAAEPADG